MCMERGEGEVCSMANCIQLHNSSCQMRLSNSLGKYVSSQII